VGKYDGLRRYLRRLRAPEVELRFHDIEQMIGALLPKAARDGSWWRDGPDETAPCPAWRDLGYEAALMGQDRVRFRRLACPAAGPADVASPAPRRRQNA